MRSSQLADLSRALRVNATWLEQFKKTATLALSLVPLVNGWEAENLSEKTCKAQEEIHPAWMFYEVDTKEPRVAEEIVASIYLSMFPDADEAFVPQAFQWAGQFFSGQYADYQTIDAGYHDFEHTLQGTLCMVRLLQGRQMAQALPLLSRKGFELGLLAILFHDTGYLKKKTDNKGTGAKYTLTHVNRSAAFVREFLFRKGWSEVDLTAIENMIRCTGVNVDLQAIPFQYSEEQMVGFALGTSDLLGQMAAPDYVEKLPVLYEEFAEAARLGGKGAKTAFPFTSAEDLMRKTPAFWKGYVRTKIDGDFERLYQFLNKPYPDGPNEYIQRIERNMKKLQRKLTAKVKTKPLKTKVKVKSKTKAKAK